MEEFELEPNEKVLLEVRQHPIVIFFHLLPYPILALLPFVVLMVVNFGLMNSPVAANGGLSPITFNTTGMRFGLGTWWLFIWMAFFASLTKSRLTVWVITSTRIVDIHQYGFFNRVVSSFLLIRVQDVTTGVRGLFATVFGFGSINVETAGSEEKFVMYGLNNPENIRDLIMREVSLLHPDGMSVGANV